MDQVSVLRMVAALLVVIGLLFGLYWGLRRFSGFAPNTGAAGDLRVREWKQIDPRRKLAVIEWGESEHLLLLGQGADIHVASRDRPPQSPPTTPPANDRIVS